MARVDPSHRVVVEIGAVEPLAEEGGEVAARHLLRHRLEVLRRDMVQLPAAVERLENPPHYAVAHDVPELLEEEIAPVVDHQVVNQEIGVILADQIGRLGLALERQLKNRCLQLRIVPPPRRHFPEPAGLEAGEPLVHEAFAPLIVGENAHRVVVAHLVEDQPLAVAAQHDHHRELGAPALDSMKSRHLRPGKPAVQLCQPRQRDPGALHRRPVPPFCRIGGEIQHVDRRAVVVSLLVAILRIERDGEVMNLLGVPDDTLAPGAR